MTFQTQCVHIDFAGPFMDQMFLLLVNAYFKWGEVNYWPSLQLQHLFAVYGLPEQVVSDNGPQFTSEEFKKFLKANGVKHSRCSPYYPSSMGLLKRFVSTFKQAMNAGKHDRLSIGHQLENFLMSYQTTLHATTGVPPCISFWDEYLNQT